MKDQYHSKYVTLEGFFAINKYLLELMKIKNSWLILNSFGYGKKLDISDEVFSNELVIQDFASVELKEKALLYIRRLYNKFRENNYLTKSWIEKIFYPIDGSIGFIPSIP